MAIRILTALFSGLLPIMALATPLDTDTTFDHQPWTQLLSTHVVTMDGGKSTAVDYGGMKSDSKKLEHYLNSLAGINQVVFDRWDKQTQLAFLINAYNAWTVDLILSKWPDLKSIKDLGSLFRSPWSKSFIPLLGKTRSLDEIEHDLIRGSNRYRDPRIHFAVNCASVGCPALRTEAYIGSRLDQQLDEQVRLFLSDSKRNRFVDGELQVSPIFKWYREDFEKGWLGYHSLVAFFVDHVEELGLPKNRIPQLKADDIDIEFLDYDWRLNAKQ